MLHETDQRSQAGTETGLPATLRRALHVLARNAAVAAGTRAAAVREGDALVVFDANGRRKDVPWDAAARVALGLARADLDAPPGGPAFVWTLPPGDDVPGYRGICVMDVGPRPDGLHPAQVAAIESLAAKRHVLFAGGTGDGWKAAAFPLLVAVQARLSAGGSLVDRLGDVVEAAMSAIPGADGGAFEVRRGDAIVHLAARGTMVSQQGHGLPYPGSAAAGCWETRKPLYLSRPAGTVSVPGMRGCALAPVERGGQVAGVLKLCSSRADALGDGCLDVLSAFAGLASGVLATMAAEEAGAAAAESEARYRAVFGTLTDEGIVVSDTRGRVTDWNVGAERIFGWTRDAMVGRHVSALYAPVDAAAGIPASEEARALDEGRHDAERTHVRADGTPFWASVGTAPLAGADGSAAGFVRSVRDQTARHGAETALRAERGLLRTITDHAGPAMLQMDARGKVTFANPSACRMFGWEAADLVGRDLHDTLHHTRPDGTPYPRHECGIADALRRGMTVPDAEDTFFRKDGRPVDVLVTNAPVVVDGAVASAVVTIVDITARKASEARVSSLASLGDALRSAPGARSMARAAGETACRVLGLDRAGYAEVSKDGTVAMVGDWAGPGLDSLGSRGHVANGDAFALLLSAGSEVSLDGRGSRRGPLPDCGALAVLPVREGGVTVGCLFAAGAGPREWSPEDLAFLRAVADRACEALAREVARERQDLLNAEIVHRMKNLLAMVHAIAMQSTRGSTDVPTVRESLGRRILALGSAHDILVGGSAVRAPVASVITGGVGVHGEGGRFSYDGPHVEIGADAALSLALTVHELATNAAKYGALSNDTGRVDVAWSLEPGEEGEDLAITWRESGGPPVRPPERKGFGSRLIERGLAGRVGASVTLEFDPAGLRCSVRAPLAGFLG